MRENDRTRRWRGFGEVPGLGKWGPIRKLGERAQVVFRSKYQWRVQEVMRAGLWPRAHTRQRGREDCCQWRGWRTLRTGCSICVICIVVKKKNKNKSCSGDTTAPVDHLWRYSMDKDDVFGQWKQWTWETNPGPAATASEHCLGHAADRSRT